MGYDKAEYRAKIRRFNDARSSLMSSNLPPMVKLTVFHILDFTKFEWNFEWSWVAEEVIANKVGLNVRTIARHIKVLRKLGVFTVETKAAEQWDSWLRATYGSKLPWKEKWPANAFNGYLINWDHPVWNCKPNEPGKGIDQERAKMLLK